MKTWIKALAALLSLVLLVSGASAEITTWGKRSFYNSSNQVFPHTAPGDSVRTIAAAATVADTVLLLGLYGSVDSRTKLIIGASYTSDADADTALTITPYDLNQGVLVPVNDLVLGDSLSVPMKGAVSYRFAGKLILDRYYFGDTLVIYTTNPNVEGAATNYRVWLENWK